MWRSDGKLVLFADRCLSLETRLGAFTHIIEVANVVPFLQIKKQTDVKQFAADHRA